MRGGLERWKRGVDSRGVRNAVGYAFEGTCDAHASGAHTLAQYSNAGGASVTRFIAQEGELRSDELSSSALQVWLTGHDPVTGEERGRQRLSADADLVLDGTVNAPKSFSIAALLHPALGTEFEALQDRLRDRIILTWQRELNARRGHDGLERMGIVRLEVVELQHRRSRALDPHVHRHLWLNVKVQGTDGRWSNVDSRVAMRLQTLINAEGELAARTDPEWVAALAQHGYTLSTDGEVAELAHVVAPLSRRSNQIETNRARLIARWRDANPGLEPTPRVLTQIDRQAWALSRPDKPADIHEGEWENAVRGELFAIDSTLARERPPLSAAGGPVESVDVQLLAQMAVADADGRATSSAARFSVIDVRAGAMRAVSDCGVVAPRDELAELISAVAQRALKMTTNLLADSANVPDHVKNLMATDTARAKIRLSVLLDAIALPGSLANATLLAKAAASVGGGLPDAQQVHAAAAIAGTDGLVVVTGPAGAGKTTMLRLAHACLQQRRARMILVAPTKKAASVAAREVGAAATSLHALLYDHGYRWVANPAGATVWTRLRAGEIDPTSARTYEGANVFSLRAGDRIVVDEAGMLDLHAANALIELAREQRATVALVGDPRQALPVGHSGAMATATRRATRSVELDTVHRFSDPTYAALTLRLRNTSSQEEARRVAVELVNRGIVARVSSVEAAQEAMVSGYLTATRCGKRVALVTATNADAQRVNEAIQQARINANGLDATRLALGKDEQRILVGDTVQTRRNDRASGVENRATWVVRAIHNDSIDLVSAGDSSDLRRISRDYAADHLHLAYATTVHGIQGETVDDALVGPGVDAAGLYVGLTRGRARNSALVVASTATQATESLAATMLRGSEELSVTDAVRAARRDLTRSAQGPAVVGTSSALSAPQSGIG
jgi:DNA transposition AAA+ family ATPase